MRSGSEQVGEGGTKDDLPVPLFGSPTKEPSTPLLETTLTGSKPLFWEGSHTQLPSVVSSCSDFISSGFSHCVSPVVGL